VASLVRSLTKTLPYRIAGLLPSGCKPDRIVLGGDVRDTSRPLKRRAWPTAARRGCERADLGFAGHLKRLYFATFPPGCGRGIEGGRLPTTRRLQRPQNAGARRFVRPILLNYWPLCRSRVAEANDFMKLIDGRDPTVPDRIERGNYSWWIPAEAYIQHLLELYQSRPFYR